MKKIKQIVNDAKWGKMPTRNKYSERVDNIAPHIKQNMVSLNDVLNKIDIKNATKDTPKSRTNLVYSFGDYTDLNIGYALIKNDKVKLSKGISIIIGKRELTKNEWNTVDNISLNGTISLKEFNKCIILQLSENFFKELLQIIKMMDDWSIRQKSFVLGIDAFNLVEAQQISSIELLSFVSQLKQLKAVFYYHRSNQIQYLNINDTWPTEYLPEGKRNEGVINCMTELKILLRSYDNTNAIVYKELLNSIINKDIISSSRNLNKIKTCGMNIYDNWHRTYLWPNRSKYRMGFCTEKGGIYVPYKEEIRKFLTGERFILVTRDTKLMLNGELIQKINQVDISSFKAPNITWLDGVPGCGKTHYIVTNHSPGQDLILAQTRLGIKDIRQAVLEKHGEQARKRIMQDYRTVSSYIINASNTKYRNVYIDEATLMHAGYVGFISQLTRAKNIFLLGDSKQISYIERSTLKTKWASINNISEPQFCQPTTRRCPIDVCYALKNQYPIISTNNEIVRSILKSKNNGEFHQISTDTIILTFTQVEKELVLKELAKRNSLHVPVNTIHEAQGHTSKHVVVIRMNTKPLPIYNSQPHAVVALTRHTESLIYLTNGEKDELSMLIDRANNCDQQTLRKWHTEAQLLANKLNATVELSLNMQGLYKNT